MLSGKYGTISTARVVSCVFALFTLIVLSLVIRHMLAINNASLLHEWVVLFRHSAAFCSGW